MKVMAFNARPDERAFFDHFGQSLNMDLELPAIFRRRFWRSSQKTACVTPRCAPSVTTT